MLYKLTRSDDAFENLESLPFLDFSELRMLEKDLEIILAEHLFDVLFEGAALMPIFQERAMQAEADIYALNHDGDLPALMPCSKRCVMPKMPGSGHITNLKSDTRHITKRMQFHWLKHIKKLST